MRCADVRDHLLAPDDGPAPGLSEHLAACGACAAFAARQTRLDVALRSALVVEAPPDLGMRLATMARAAARPARVAGVASVPSARAEAAGWPALAAVVLLMLAGWRVADLGSGALVLGDVVRAVELVATSPAGDYLGQVPVDLAAILTWTLVAVAGWLFSRSSSGRAVTRG